MHQWFNAYEEALCDLRDIQASMPSSGGLDLLEEQQRRREVLGFIRLITPVLHKADRRILHLYICGYSLQAIAYRVHINKPNVLKRINKMPKKLQGLPLDGLRELLQPKASTLTAHAPEVMLGSSFDSSMKSYDGSYWGKSNGKREWKTKVVCRAPEYFQKCFGDNDTKCGYCGVKCTRRRTNV